MGKRVVVVQVVVFGGGVSEKKVHNFFSELQSLGINMLGYFLPKS